MGKLPEKDLPVGKLLENTCVYEELGEAINERFKLEAIKKAAYKTLASKKLLGKEEVYKTEIDWDGYLERLNSREGNPIYSLNLRDETDSVALDFKLSENTGELYGEILYHNGKEKIPFNKKIEIEEIKSPLVFERYGTDLNFPIGESNSASKISTKKIEPRFEEVLKTLRKTSFLNSLNFIGKELLDVLSGKISYESFLIGKTKKDNRTVEEFEEWFEDNFYYYLSFTGAMLDEGLKKIKKEISSSEIYRNDLTMEARLFKANDIHSQFEENWCFLPDVGANVSKGYINSIWALSKKGFLPELKEMNEILKSGDNKKISELLKKRFPKNITKEIKVGSVEKLTNFINRSSNYDKYHNALNDYLTGEAYEELKEFIEECK